MNKTLFALAGGAAAILMPVCASAQSSVTLFGVVETGVQHLTNVNAAGASVTNLASGNYAASRWGMLGTEDLGGGYKAMFRIEAGFNADDGSNASAASFFNRYSQVSLGAPWGTVTAGRTGSVKFDKTALYDPLLFSNYSNISLGQVPPAYLKVNNAVKYQSPSFGGFNVELMYGLGQEAGALHRGLSFGCESQLIHYRTICIRMSGITRRSPPRRSPCAGATARRPRRSSASARRPARASP